MKGFFRRSSVRVSSLEVSRLMVDQGNLSPVSELKIEIKKILKNQINLDVCYYDQRLIISRVTSSLHR